MQRAILRDSFPAGTGAEAGDLLSIGAPSRTDLSDSRSRENRLEWAGLRRENHTYMKSLLVLCVAALSAGSLMRAQDTPHYEFFVGGSLLHVHGDGDEVGNMLNLSDVTYQPHDINLNLPGWEVTFAENANRYWGLEVDANGFYGSSDASFLFPASQLVSPTPNFNLKVPVSTQYAAYLFGPRFTIYQSKRMTIFAHLPIGVARVGESVSESAVVASTLKVLPSGSIGSSAGFALSPGFGVDYRVSPMMTLRPVQIDYLLSEVFGTRQNNLRYSAGVNFTFGEK